MAEKVAPTAPATAALTGTLKPEEERTLVERARMAVDLYRLLDQYERMGTKWGDIKGKEETYKLGDYAKLAFEGSGFAVPTASTSVQEVLENCIVVADRARSALRNELDAGAKIKQPSPAIAADLDATRTRYNQVLGLIGCDNGPTAYCMALRRDVYPVAK